MKLAINNIKIKERKRRVSEEKVVKIATSIAEIGLINPVTVKACNGGYELIAGLHRLNACQYLGWNDIEANVFNGDEMEVELAEIDENLMRNDLTVLEQSQHLKRREEILSANGNRREAGRYQSFNGATVAPLKTTKDMAAEIGLSERSIQQRLQIAKNILPEVQEIIENTHVSDSTTQLLELSKMKPDEQHRVASMLKTSSSEMTIPQAKREIVKAQRSETPELPSDKYRIVYADPPWSYGNSGAGIDNYGPAERHYTSMSIEELCDLPIKEMVEDNAVLFMWVTSPLLEECFPVIKAWGFKYKTSFVWDKVKHNFGHYNSVRHELLLVCTRGSCTPDVPQLFDSVQSIERSEKHSEKPEEFRKIIDTLYTRGKRIELFARATAENWKVWGNEPGIH